MWTWNTTAISSNVHLITATGKDIRQRGNCFEILVQADQHFDNVKYCRRDIMKRHLDEAAEKDAPVIGLGDLFCAMQGRHDKRQSAGSNPFPDRGDYFDAIVEEAVEFHKPYAQQLAVYARGNHETSVTKNAGTDLLANWAYRVNAEAGSGPFVGGYGGWILVRLQEEGQTFMKTCKIKYYHGSGGGGQVSRNVIDSNRKAVFLPDADVVIRGHVHEDWSLSITRERLTRAGRIYLDEQLHVQAPTYKDEYRSGHSGWHVERGAPPKPVGGMWLTLTLDSVQTAKGGANEYVIRPDVRRAR